MYFTLDTSHIIEQFGFSPVSVKQTQWLALRLVKYTGVLLSKADPMIDRYRDRFKFLSALQIKYFRKKLIFYDIQCKMKGIPQSRNT